MEILAAVSALSSLNKQRKWEVELHSDSALLSDAINKGWLKNWAARGWIKSDKKPGKANL
jgi:ribonuclease HI